MRSQARSRPAIGVIPTEERYIPISSTKPACRSFMTSENVRRSECSVNTENSASTGLGVRSPGPARVSDLDVVEDVGVVGLCRRDDLLEVLLVELDGLLGRVLEVDPLV